MTLREAQPQLPLQHRDPLPWGYRACAGWGVGAAVTRATWASEPEFLASGLSLARDCSSMFRTLLGSRRLLSFISGLGRTQAAQGLARDAWKQGSKGLGSATGFGIRSFYRTSGPLKTVTVPGTRSLQMWKKEKRCFLPVLALPI